MAIPSRQIGASTTTNLLWQISKQLERLICVRAGGCVSTTTTTTTTISYYYYSGNNCNSPLFSQVIRSLVPLSIDDVVLTTDGSCYTIGGVYVGPDYSVEYISTETCFVDPCPTTTTSTSTSSSTTSTTTTLPPTTTTTTTTTINCNCYTLINNTNDTLTYSYIDCLGNEINDVSIDSGITINLCTSRGSIIFTRGLILDDGVCGDVCNYSCNFYNVEPPADPPGVGWYYSYVNCDGRFIEGRLESGGRPITDCMVVGSLTYSEGLIVTNLGDCLVNTNYTFVNCPEACGSGCAFPVNYFDVWMTQACIDSWPTIGCEVWLDQNATIPFPTGVYNNGDGACITIKDGVVTAIP